MKTAYFMTTTSVLSPISLKDSFENNIKLEKEDPRKALSIYEEIAILAEAEKDYMILIDCLLKVVNLSKLQGFYSKALRQGGTALQLINHHFPKDNVRSVSYTHLTLPTNREV